MLKRIKEMQKAKTRPTTTRNTLLSPLKECHMSGIVMSGVNGIKYHSIWPTVSNHDMAIFL
jgi:hypothetical protein